MSKRGGQSFFWSSDNSPAKSNRLKAHFILAAQNARTIMRRLPKTSFLQYPDTSMHAILIIPRATTLHAFCRDEAPA
jgi:hypothetical protein